MQTFVRHAIEFVLPDQLRALAHTCGFARDLVMHHCKTIERGYIDGCPNQSTIVRMLRYSSLTGLMYNESKRTEFLHFACSNFQLACGFACHNDDLELLKYIDSSRLIPLTDLHSDMYLIINATPQPDRKIALSLFCSEFHNCTQSYRIFAHMCKERLKNVGPESFVYSDSIQSDVLSCLLICAIRSDSIPLAEYVISRYMTRAKNYYMDKYFTYESVYISPRMVAYLSQCKWFAKVYAKYATRDQFHDMIDELQNRSDVVSSASMADRVGQQNLITLMIGALIKRNDRIVNLCRYRVPRNMNYYYPLVLCPAYTINILSYNISQYVTRKHLQEYNYNFMSRATWHRLLPLYRVQKQIYDYCNDIFACSEMGTNMTDCHMIYPRIDYSKIGPAKSLYMICHILGVASHDNQIVGPASRDRMNYIYSEAMKMRESHETRALSDVTINRIIFTAGLLCASVDIMRESRHVVDMRSDEDRTIMNFVVSRRYTRIYDADQVLAFIGESGVFRDYPHKIMSMHSIDAISAVMRGMSTCDLVILRDYIRQCVSVGAKVMVRRRVIAKVMLIECMARAIMRLRMRAQ